MEAVKTGEVIYNDDTARRMFRSQTEWSEWARHRGYEVRRQGRERRLFVAYDSDGIRVGSFSYGSGSFHDVGPADEVTR